MSASDEIFSRLKATAEFDIDTFFRHAIDRVEAQSESPIETLLGATMLICIKIFGAPCWRFGSIEGEISAVQQYQWRSHRIDLAVFLHGKPAAFIECDGHQFHERSKEQAERDRSRDREIQTAGIVALRFTGREIWRDPFSCVNEIICALRPLVEREGML